ncbi:hypothetical protein FIBSPDRAFT_870560 [Athelia psychrophila]|uniref:Uncharacterized protein n=1 Tax=Athelia psychrophila TaxID=1759441 RepID=A0A166B2M7_9AGAM|nr:hypothetical protein FIBSPDRAFT_870560 [Fibularhizoctonia sp. CBS 109695]
MDAKEKYANSSNQLPLRSLEEYREGWWYVPRSSSRLRMPGELICAGFGITHRGRGYRIATEDSSRNSGDMMQNRRSRSIGKLIPFSFAYHWYEAT